MARKVAALISWVAVASTPSSALAADVSGVQLPDRVTLQGKTLSLNGTGVRQAKIVFKVYAAGLYLENPGHDPDAIANSDQFKSLEIVFMRDTTGKQMSEALEEAFDKNCLQHCALLKPDVVRLEGLLKDVRKGETMAYHFLPDGVEVMIRGQKAGMIGDKVFSHQFIRCWIGKNPPTQALKEGLLGKKQ